jgi:hypothetical protein
LLPNEVVVEAAVNPNRYRRAHRAHVEAAVGGAGEHGWRLREHRRRRGEDEQERQDPNG